MSPATDPYDAADKIAVETPDVITLDLEMPRMNGLVFLRKIMRQRPIPVVIITGKSTPQVENTIEAFYEGAVDVVNKSDIQPSDRNSVKRITDKVWQLSFSKIKRIASHPVPNHIRYDSTANDSFKNIVMIGASSGGIRAIHEILNRLSGQIPPVILVQHMSESFTGSFASHLNKRLPYYVKEAQDAEPLRKNLIYVAPGGRHLVVGKQAQRIVLFLNNDPAVNHVKPSVDKLFLSAVQQNVPNVYAFLLTGMGRDGAEGLLALKENQAYTVAQNRESSAIFGMPGEAIKLGAAKKVLGLPQMADLINSLNKNP
jgi:two-component system chemotaxis response regulator CheB